MSLFRSKGPSPTNPESPEWLNDVEPFAFRLWQGTIEQLAVDYYDDPAKRAWSEHLGGHDLFVVGRLTTVAYRLFDGLARSHVEKYELRAQPWTQELIRTVDYRVDLDVRRLPQDIWERSASGIDQRYLAGELPNDGAWCDLRGVLAGIDWDDAFHGRVLDRIRSRGQEGPQPSD